MFNNADHFKEWKKLADAIEEHGPTACTNDPDGFFPHNETIPDANTIIRACKECPIRLQCGEYGIFWEPNHGIWGGLTVKERRVMRKKMQIVTFAPNSLIASLKHDQPSS